MNPEALFMSRESVINHAIGRILRARTLKFPSPTSTVGPANLPQWDSELLRFPVCDL